MSFAKSLTLLLGLSVLSFSSAQALVKPLNRQSLYDYLTENNPARVTISILRKSTAPNQVRSVIAKLNQTYTQRTFSADCQAQVQVVPNSYVPHKKQNDSEAYGVVSVDVTYNCFPALGQVMGEFTSNSNINVRVPARLAAPVAPSNAIENPMDYAQEVSQEYAGGDTNDSSGWNACWYEKKSKTQPQIGCDGSRTILVFGGQPQEVAFSCSFEFKKAGTSYQVVSESCE